MHRLLTVISRGLPVWVLLGAVLAYLLPEAFQWTAWEIFDQKFFTWMFAITMFAVGTVIEPRHFSAVIRSPVPVALGLLTQFTVMPLCAWLVACVAGFSDALTLGFILVGCAPGAMTSNVLTYLARGDTAFSVTLTTIASLLAVVITPLLVELLAGEKLGMTAEKFWASLWTIAWTVAIPVILGLTVRVAVPVGRKLYATTSPAIASVAIVIICCHVIQSNHERLGQIHKSVLICVVIVNAVGFAVGYLLAFLYRFSRERRVTLCIEIGMQNAGMGVVLASTTFEDRPEVAVPSALFAIWCVLTGAGLIEVLKLGRERSDQ
jgi:BASS family bile acid:Na+ symporter